MASNLQSNVLKQNLWIYLRALSNHTVETYEGSYDVGDDNNDIGEQQCSMTMMI